MFATEPTEGGGTQMALRAPERRAPDDHVLAGTRLLLFAFLGLTLLAVLELLVFADRTGHDFAWSIHTEATAAFLGAAFAAGAVLSVLSLRQKVWSRIRVAVMTVTLYTALALTATLIHHHRLHLWDGSALAGFASWLWLAVYLVIPFAGLAVVIGQERRRDPAQVVRRPMPAVLLALLAVQGLVLAAGGAVLFLGGLTVHHMVEHIATFWPWELTPLSAQVIGAWLLAFGFAAALTIGERDLSRLLVPAVTYTVFGVLELLVLVRYRSQVSVADPRLWLYVAFLLTAVATGGYGWWAARQRAVDADRADRRTGAGALRSP